MAILFEGTELLQGEGGQPLCPEAVLLLNLQPPALPPLDHPPSTNSPCLQPLNLALWGGSRDGSDSTATSLFKVVALFIVLRVKLKL